MTPRVRAPLGRMRSRVGWRTAVGWCVRHTHGRVSAGPQAETTVKVPQAKRPSKSDWNRAIMRDVQAGRFLRGSQGAPMLEAPAALAFHQPASVRKSLSVPGALCAAWSLQGPPEMAFSTTTQVSRALQHVLPHVQYRPVRCRSGVDAGVGAQQRAAGEQQCRRGGDLCGGA